MVSSILYWIYLSTLWRFHHACVIEWIDPRRESRVATRDGTLASRLSLSFLSRSRLPVTSKKPLCTRPGAGHTGTGERGVVFQSGSSGSPVVRGWLRSVSTSQMTPSSTPSPE